MNKTMLLASSAAIALTAGSANLGARVKAPNIHRIHLSPTEVLYDQNNPDFSHLLQSDNFTSGINTAFDSAGADDFVVPAGHKWTITEVDVSGEYIESCTSGCATSEIVTFYRNRGGHPGPIAGRGADTFTLNCTDNSGFFACSIPNNSRGKPVTLRGGKSGLTYWVSFVVNCDLPNKSCQWQWWQTAATSNNPGKWQNPGNGTRRDCLTWTNTSACWTGYPDDHAFDLIGTQQ